MIALAERLTDLKYELFIACPVWDVQFVSYTFSGIKMKIYKLFMLF
jgi:hypothetical protein